MGNKIGNCKIEMPLPDRGIYRRSETDEKRIRRENEELIESFLEPPKKGEEGRETNSERAERMRRN